MMRETVAIAAFIGYLKPVFLPRLIEQRNHPVIEEVEKILKCMVLLANSLAYQLGIIERQNSHGPGESHEIHHHERRRTIAPLEGLNAAGWERKRGIYTKAHNLAGRRPERANGIAVRTQPFQQAYCLKEIEGPDIIPQFPLQPVELAGRDS